MDTAPQAGPLAPDIRARALVIIAMRLGVQPDLAARLDALPNLQLVNLLIDLEQAFAIPLDVDETLDLTLAGLLIMVQRRAILGPRFEQAWTTPPDRQPDCQLYDFAAFAAAQRDAAHAAAWWSTRQHLTAGRTVAFPSAMGEAVARVLAPPFAEHVSRAVAAAEPRPLPRDPPPIVGAHAPTLPGHRARHARRGDLPRLFALAALAGALAGVVFFALT